MIKNFVTSGNARIISLAQALNIDRNNRINRVVISTAGAFSRFSTEGKIGILGIICIILIAVFAPMITIYPPQKITGDSLEPPGPGHILGTDELGMDIWSQICYGARISLTIGLAVAFAAGFGGGAIGILAGYI